MLTRIHGLNTTLHLVMADHYKILRAGITEKLLAFAVKHIVRFSILRPKHETEMETCV